MEDTTKTEDVEITNPPAEVNIDTKEAEPTVDYKVKFSESSKEALRLLEESKLKDAEIERLKKLSEEGTNYSNDSESLYPGFENLGEDEKKNLIAYTNSIKDNTLKDIYKDPAIAFAKQSYGEKVWNDAFSEVLSEYPELAESKDEFKTKYFKSDNVPSNIKDILKDVAKIHLFDKAQDIGAKRAVEQSERIDIERAKGGDKTPTATRSLEDWQKMAQSNPSEFAKKAKEFNADMESGKLK